MTTTSADGNHDEAERRKQLTRFDSIPSLSSYLLKPITFARSLEDIEKQSQALLDKGKLARILDKRQDSGKVVKLVEELGQAILLYQVGIIENRRSCRFNAFGIAIATTVHRPSGHTIDCKSPQRLPPLELTGSRSNQSSFNAFMKLREVQQPAYDVRRLLT